ncbi:tyrosine-protein kinase SRK3-like [Lingula anatina]|uniref:non-specific protein-tyrosine kinase n=1 Tax=Lingula anatina TaxID=7574 RepID=A0A2R2MKD2_LINAN|nr:tyrosine-protein kinase SRK3-like [Lingula anatina]|eukprot:XP_023930522.1 tyrosine-protein kinase SRK3-like [Lingula anatina]
MLQQRKREGCFMVYPSSKNDGYYLAVCDEFGQVWPYPIKEEDREFSLGGDYRVFPTLKDLVNYFRCSRYGLVTRLRRPFKEAHLAITPGHHYQKSFEIEDDLQEGTKLGNGQFGIVVNATLKTQDVAAKMLHTQDVSDSAEDDFLNEAQTLMRLCHDHIIKLVGVRFSQEPFAIVMEKMPCGNLRQWLKNNEVSDLPYFDVFENIASALKYLERQRYILHRDVAARNVLLNESFHAKLADFGMARYVEDDRYRACKNEKISVKWAAPEVLEEAVYSTKSDVWAFGIFLWEVLSNGQPPYPEKNNREAAIFVKQGKIMDFPSTKGKLNKKTPLEKADLFYDIMKQCWHPLPENRPTSSQLHELVAPAKNYYPVDGTVRQTKLMSKKSNKPLPLVPQTDENHFSNDEKDAASRGPPPPPPKPKHRLPPPFPGTKLVNDAAIYDSDSDSRKSDVLAEENLGEPADEYALDHFELPKVREKQKKKWTPKKFWKK